MKRPGSNIVRAVCIAALAGPIVLTAPALAQGRIDAARLARERAAYVHDMLRFIAVAIRRGGALSVGKVEASADGGLVRIHNLVLVVRRYPLVLSIRLIQIRDLDRTHLLPHRMKVDVYGAQAEMGTIPQIMRGMMLALGVRTTRVDFSVDYTFDQRKSTFTLDSLKLQWAGYAAAKLSGHFVNVPDPNTVVELATSPGSATERLQAIRIKDWRLTLLNKSANDVFFKSAAFIRREDVEKFKTKTLALLEKRAQNASTQLERDFWQAARTVISGASVASVAGVAATPVSFGALQNIHGPREAEKLFRIRFDAKTVSAATIDKDMAEPKLTPWNVKAVAMTDPPRHECDRVAAAPDDGKRKAAAVPDGGMDRIVALAACKRAVMEYPAAPRFQFEYGRALAAADQRQLARRYLRKASEANYAAATLHLGRTYVDPTSSSQDPAEAMRLFRKAEAQGSKAAKLAIARAYLYGRGVEKDVDQAVKLVDEDGLDKRPLGKLLLGDMYWHGWGHSRDRGRALALYQDAAEHGVTLAQMRLVEIYGDGSQGVKADPAKAYFWLRVLARQGAKRFVKKHAAVNRKLEFEARKRIDKTVRDWLPKGI